MNNQNYVLRSRMQMHSHPTASCLLMGAFSICLLIFGIVTTFAGSIITGIAYRKFNASFYNTSMSLRIAGPILTTVGLLSLFISVLLICIASHMNKSSHQRLEEDMLAVPETEQPPISPINATTLSTQFSNPQYFETNNQIINNYPDLPPPYSEIDHNR